MLFTYSHANGTNQAGQLTNVKDASGEHQFFYGDFGEVIEKRSQFFVPNTGLTDFFTTRYSYDLWNRIQTLTYPDGEVLTYHYHEGGELNRITGVKGQDNYTYLDEQRFNEFGEKTYVRFGNTSNSTYTYDPVMRRLTNKVSRRSLTNPIFENLTYTYDAVGNISSIQNSANPVAGLGGNFTHNYQYDKDNRLITANGNTDIMVSNPNSSNSTNANFHYNQDYTYSPSGRILSQNVSSNSSSFINGSTSSLARSWTYGYGQANNPILQPNTLTKIGSASGDIFNRYDAGGNLTWTGDNNLQVGRKLCWDEKSQLKATFDVNGHGAGLASIQAYDASGNRFLKLGGMPIESSINGANTLTGINITSLTLYVSQDMTVERTQYFKHVFAGSERIATKPCGEPSRTRGFGFMVMPPPPSQGDPNDTVAVPGGPIMATQQAGPSYGFADRPQAWSQYLSSIGECASGVSSFNLLGLMHFTGAYNTHIRNLASTPVENQLYFYHTDHLGSSGFISRLVTSGAGIGTGRLTQHYQYLPFGENFIHQKGTNFGTNNPYEFNGKEKDLETGYNYYGARHYNASWGVWLSVDPKAYAFPNVSPYTFNMNNPVMFIDPGGDSTFVVNVGNNRYEVVGAEVESGNRGVYEVCVNKDGGRELTGNDLGNSLTTHSFVDDNNNAVLGTIIDMNSNEGQNFIDEIINDHPGLFTYAIFPKTGGKNGKYDFKTRDIDKRGDLSKLQYKYRGSVSSNGEIGSARDFGNIGAGIVAGRRGLTWDKARSGFDGYQGGVEPPVSQLAQRIGFDMGQAIRRQSEARKLSNPGRNIMGPKF